MYSIAKFVNKNECKLLSHKNNTDISYNECTLGFYFTHINIKATKFIKLTDIFR